MWLPGTHVHSFSLCFIGHLVQNFPGEKGKYQKEIPSLSTEEMRTNVGASQAYGWTSLPEGQTPPPDVF
jgi:hypothetical protein